MTSLLAVDPGNDMGFARFEDGRLVDAGLWSSSDEATCYGDGLIIERPQVYGGGRGKGDPNDLITLAILVGEVKRRAKDARMSTFEVKPHEWKGSVDKKVHGPRIVAVLDSGETMILDRILKEIPSGKRHNVVDAVGLGAWALGRLPRGGS